MKKKVIRIGIVGLGGICRSRHVPGLRRIPDVEIVCVANRTRESSEKAAREFDIPEICNSWQELVARPDLDAVFIGTWPYMHKEISVAALNAGKHVFCQARMAMNFAEALEMYKAARQTGLVAMLCPVPIGLLYDSTIKRFLRENRLGEIRLIRVQSLSNAYADPDVPMNWRKDHRISGLNMLTLGMYIEVIHRWFGWTRAVEGDTQIFIYERRDPSGKLVKVEIPDQIMFHALMESGVPAQYLFSAVVHHGVDRIEIYGSEATVFYDVANEKLRMALRHDKDFSDVQVMPEDAYDLQNWRVEQDFIDAISTGKEYHPNFEDGLRYMQVIQAVYDSAKEKRQIELTDPTT